MNNIATTKGGTHAAAQAARTACQALQRKRKDSLQAGIFPGGVQGHSTVLLLPKKTAESFFLTSSSLHNPEVVHVADQLVEAPVLTMVPKG